MAKTDKNPGVGGDQFEQDDLLRAQKERVQSAITYSHDSLTALLRRIRAMHTDAAEGGLDSETEANRAAAIAESQEILTVTEAPPQVGFLKGAILKAEIIDGQRVFTLTFPELTGIHDDFVIGPDFARCESQERALFPQQPKTPTVGPATTSAFTVPVAESIKTETSRLNMLRGIRFSYQRVPKS